MAWIIIDIDGVLNPFSARYNPQLQGFTEFSFGKNTAFLNHDLHTRWIQKLSQRASFVWGSAWAEESNDILRMLDQEGSWDWIPLQTEDVGLGTWKIKSVKRWVDENVPTDELVVWIDDELEGDAFTWAQQRGNMLAVQPDKFRGLQEEDFQQILLFLTNNR